MCELASCPSAVGKSVWLWAAGHQPARLPVGAPPCALPWSDVQARQLPIANREAEGLVHSAAVSIAGRPGHAARGADANEAQRSRRSPCARRARRYRRDGRRAGGRRRGIGLRGGGRGPGPCLRAARKLGASLGKVKMWAPSMRRSSAGVTCEGAPSADDFGARENGPGFARENGPGFRHESSALRVVGPSGPDETKASVSDLSSLVRAAPPRRRSAARVRASGLPARAPSPIVRAMAFAES
jgi:hypothetical protein